MPIEGIARLMALLIKGVKNEAIPDVITAYFLKDMSSFTITSSIVMVDLSVPERE